MDDADRTVERFNPLCGDHLTLYVKVEEGVVKDASFQGSGCAISTTSVSLMTELVKDKTQADCHQLFELFHKITTGDEQIRLEEMDKLTVLAGVK